MEQKSTPNMRPSAHDQQVEDLHHRIELLESIDEAELGAFTGFDWAVCIVGAVVIPTLVLLWVGR